MAGSWRSLLAASMLWLVGLIVAAFNHRWALAGLAAVLLVGGVGAAALRRRWEQPRQVSRTTPRPRREVDLRADGNGDPCAVTVRRGRPGSAQARRFKVILDGSVVARLWVGQAVRLQLDPGRHRLAVAMSKRWHSDEVEFDGGEGERLTADVSPMRLDLRRAPASEG